MKKILYFLTALTFVACSDDIDTDTALSADQVDLLGKSVNFNATRASEFNHQSRATYNDTGVFNENDLMRIFRQYALDAGGWGDEAYRTYYFNTKYATGTQISLGTDWRVYPGRKGKDSDGTVINNQQEKDSITWENGKTVRFRSWTRSNYANCLSSCYKYKSSEITNFYPDFSISDWVTVSGPTEQVPLTMRHICSRIAFSHRENYANQIYKVELATDLEDYKRKDNADTAENDNSDTEANKTEAQAQEELNAVMAAYNRMCMPAGVDIDKSELYAMTKAYWEPLDNNTTDNNKLRFLENEDPETFYHFGAKDADYVEEKVQRPLFGNVNGSCYLVTIPYDMSNGGTQGNIITLPACTRFRVYMRDVNRGDNVNKGEYEGTYHIFSLADIKDNQKNPVFPNGLEMNPGYSYKFYVGYRYDKLTITANDNFSWDAQDAEEAVLADADQTVPVITTSDYSWWKETIKNAIPKDGGDFNPIFHIKTQKEFLEFINLVNNTAATSREGLKRAKRNVVNPEHADNYYDKYNWWYTDDCVSANKRDTTFLTTEEVEQRGYILYESYYPANGNQPAYSQEEYIKGPYPFYDQTRDRHYTVYLDNDIDLADWQLPSIGNTEANHFQGYFDGQMNCLYNVNMGEEYLFKYIDKAAIRNLRLESTHKLSLVMNGTNTCYIIGVSILANSTTNSIAASLTSNEYNNPSYVVGCIHVGDAGGALVGASGNLYMQGCMQAAEGIPSGQGALLGGYLPYSSTSNWNFFDPQISFDYGDMSATPKGKPTWNRFMCNYYDTELSPGTNAVFTKADKYSPLEYIRGRESFILKAKNDNLLSGELTFGALKSKEQRLAFYGLAPWKAMNYAIVRYNQYGIASTHPCNAHYENNSTGYVHRYPVLLKNAPTEEQYGNTLEQRN